MSTMTGTLERKAVGSAMAGAMNEYTKWAAEYFEEEYESFRKLAGFVLRNQSDARIDELVSDVCWVKLPDVLRCWDPDKGDVDAHVRRSLKWYMWKAVQKADRRRLTETLWTESVGADAQSEDLGPEAMASVKEQLLLVQEQLGRQVFVLLRMHYIDSMSVSEISERTHLTRGTVYTRIKKGLIAAREILEDA